MLCDSLAGLAVSSLIMAVIKSRLFVDFGTVALVCRGFHVGTKCRGLDVQKYVLAADKIPWLTILAADLVVIGIPYGYNTGMKYF